MVQQEPVSVSEVGFQFAFSEDLVEFELSEPFEIYEQMLEHARTVRRERGPEHGYFYVALVQDEHGAVVAEGGTFPGAAFAGVDRT